MARQKPTDKIEELRKRQSQITAQLKALEAREREQARKDDARRKIIAGALALEHLEKNPDSEFSKQMLALLNEYVPARSRDLFPVLGPLGPPEGGQAAQVSK